MTDFRTALRITALFLRECDRMALNIPELLRKYGERLTFKKNGAAVSGAGVIISSRDRHKSDGGIAHKGNALSDPYRYYIYCVPELMKNAVRGDTVSDGENEYYVLWKDEYKSRWGDYIRACVRQVRPGG